MRKFLEKTIMATFRLFCRQILYLFLFVYLCACQSDMLNESIVLRQAQDFELAMAGVYDGLQSPELYGGKLWITAELLGNNLVSEKNMSVDDAQFLQKQINSNNQTVLNIWKKAYQIIEQNNQILVASSVLADTVLQNRYRGEALFVRTLLHFELFRLFSSDLAVPYMVMNNSSPSFQPSRDSVSVFYSKMIADLKQAATLLPKERKDGRANYWAAQALLSKIYFSKNDFKNALKTSTEIIEKSPYLLNKSVLRVYTNNDSESIFRLLSTQNDISTNFLAQSFITASAQWTINRNLQEVLNEFVLDNRWQAFYLEKQGKIFSRKYDVPQAHLPILRFAEQLLIRAESNASLNANISVIKTDLNKIRLRANLPVDNATNSAEGFLTIIEKEWLREFALEGNYFFYQKRLNKKIGNLNANDPKLVLPIPQREINLNSNLIQNKGY